MRSADNIFEKYTDRQTYEKIVDRSGITEMWQYSVKEYGDLIAITDGVPCEDGSIGRKYTYAETDKDVAAFRAVLKNAGVDKGDKVCVLCPNSYDFVKVYLAVTTLGGVAVLLPPHLDEMTVFGCCMKFGAKTLVYAEALKAKTAIAGAKNITLVAAETKSEESVAAVETSAGDPCTVLFTGGTTGRSKGALLSNGAILRGVKNGCYGYKEVFNQRYFLVLPLTHVFGLIRNLLTSVYTGSDLYICRNNKDMFKEIPRFRPTIMVLVPALAEMALNLSRQFGRFMFGDSLKYIICGAATVAGYLVKEYEKYNVTLFPGYGLTESANLVSGNPESYRKAESVGIPYPGQELKVVDGELWLKGDNMMDGYLGDEQENALAYEDGWFKTGDLVRFDEEGYLYITGRIKEVIVLSTGENVSPAEVEAKFNLLDGVQDSLVYLDENANGRECLTLEVYPRFAVLKGMGENGAEILKKQLEEVNKALPPFERVSNIVIRTSDFERSPSMKILRGKYGKKN